MLISCKKTEVPENSNLVAKYIVFDELISPKLKVCTDDTIVGFKDKGTDCMFKLEDFVFEIEHIITLDKNGHMVKFENHTVTDRIDYEKFDLERDTTDPKKLKGHDISIRFSPSKKEIIDGADTLKIERVFLTEKVLFVERKNVKKGRRNIYEYE